MHLVYGLNDAKWASQAGLEPSDQYCDLYGLDPELLAMVPRPVKAVVFLFPWTEFRYIREAEDERVAKEGGPKIDESVFWMKQTVGVYAFPHRLFVNPHIL